MSGYRSLLEKAGERAKAAPDAFEKLERRRTRKQRNKRITAGVFAFAIAIGGSVGAFTAFRGSNGNATRIGGSANDHFYALWPEQTLADAQRTQEEVDSGDPSVQWRTDVSATVDRFVTSVLGWQQATVAPIDTPGANGPGPIDVGVSTPPPPCPSPLPGSQGLMDCGPQQATITLERLVLTGGTGIWSVTAVESAFPSMDNALTLPFAPGDTVVSGTEVSLPFLVPDGMEVQASYTYMGECSGMSSFSSAEASGGQVRFPVAGSSFHERCDSSGQGGGSASSSSGGSGSADLNQPIDGYVVAALVPKGSQQWDPFGSRPPGVNLPTPIALAAEPVHFVPVSGASPALSAAVAPDVAQVACDRTSTLVLTPEVAAQPDGVHIIVTNTASSDLSLQFEEIGGDNAPVGTNEVVWPLAPGPVRLRCADPIGDAGAPGGYVQLAVVDPHGFYVPAVLQCANDQAVSGNVDYVTGAKGEQGDPVDNTRKDATGLLPTDTVEAAGYPEAATRIVRVMRDGSVAATFSFFDDGYGGWLMENYQACTDADVGWGASSVAPNPYPRGWFTWCPALAGTLPPGPTADAEAQKVALDFARAFLAGDGATVTALRDPSAPTGASWMIVGTPDGIALAGTSADPGHLVEHGCGPDVAARTVAVVLDDGTSSASADFFLFLVQRADGWKVWGSY